MQVSEHKLDEVLSLAQSGLSQTLGATREQGLAKDERDPRDDDGDESQRCRHSYPISADEFANAISGCVDDRDYRLMSQVPLQIFGQSRDRRISIIRLSGEGFQDDSV